jgi:hypothetical protein
MSLDLAHIEEPNANRWNATKLMENPSLGAADVKRTKNKALANTNPLAFPTSFQPEAHNGI